MPASRGDLQCAFHMLLAPHIAEVDDGLGLGLVHHRSIPIEQLQGRGPTRHVNELSQ